MKLISNELRIGFDVDYDLNYEHVKGVKLSVDNPKEPRLWIIYFYGMDNHKKERIIRVWFYDSEWKRTTELQVLREKHPHIKVV
jgi:hypothetical protein